MNKQQKELYDKSMIDLSKTHGKAVTDNIKIETVFQRMCRDLIKKHAVVLTGTERSKVKELLADGNTDEFDDYVYSIDLISVAYLPDCIEDRIPEVNMPAFIDVFLRSFDKSSMFTLLDPNNEALLQQLAVIANNCVLFYKGD